MKIRELLQYLKESGESFEFNGDERRDINGFSSLKNYKPGTFTWIKKRHRFQVVWTLANASLS